LYGIIHLFRAITNKGDGMADNFNAKFSRVTAENINDGFRQKISKSVLKNFEVFGNIFKNCSDVLIERSEVGGFEALFIMTDGMCNNLLVSEQILNPILTSDNSSLKADRMMRLICENTVAGIDRKIKAEYGEIAEAVLSGCFAVMLDGVDYCALFGAQGFPKRSISDALTEVDERSSHEAFCESFKDNVALMRKRLHTPLFKTENMVLGDVSRTTVCICYIENTAKPETLAKIKERLESVNFNTVLGSGYVSELLDNNHLSFFSSVGTTERPDIACAEMAEGRVAVIVDGTPYAVIVPFLFLENFQTADDYSFRPFYSLFARLIKLTAFFTAVLLPAFYIAVCTFHQEALPVAMLYDMAVQESITPFPVLIETLFIHFVYEIVREAGLRMPRAVGSAVSIVGGLVIGEAAVSAGLIASPMLIVVAFSAITSFVIPNLYQPISLLRFMFMLLSGFFGFYGITVGFTVLVLNMTVTGDYSVSQTAPLMPFSLEAMRDTFVRLNWRKLGRRHFLINRMER